MKIYNPKTRAKQNVYHKKAINIYWVTLYINLLIFCSYAFIFYDFIDAFQHRVYCSVSYLSWAWFYCSFYSVAELLIWSYCTSYFSASFFSFSPTRWKIFSMGLRSRDRAGILNYLQPIESIACLATTLFWLVSPSCKSNFPLGFADFPNILGNFS